MASKIEAFSGGYAFLSNFHRCRIEFEGAVYPSVEHAYQAAKTMDTAVREKIRAAGTPGQAKRLGQKVDRRRDWERVKIDVMLGLLEKKFSGRDLRSRLLATGDAELIEGNWWGDTFWGVCRGVGQNHLGKLLMEIRSRD